MGVFTIHPKSSAYSSITCSLLENSTTNYQVVPSTIDFNEGERVLALSGDSRAVNEYGVPIEFSMAVFGSTQGQAMARMELLRQVLSDERGGYIEYRPRGLSSSVMTTWYEYKSGKTPALTQKIKAVDRGVIDASLRQMNRTDVNVVMVACALDTRPLATSDPSSPVPLLGSTSIHNYDDADHGNSVVIYDSQIKGVGIRPIVYVGATTSNNDDAILMHIKKMRVGAHSRVGWIEPEDYAGGDMPPTTGVAGISNDGYVNADGPITAMNFFLPGADSTYIGPFKPIICARSGSASETSNSYSLRVGAGDGAYVTSSWTNWVLAAGDTNWYLIFGMRELPWPTYKIPPWITDSTSPSVADYTTAADTFAFLGYGSSQSDVDYIYIANANGWIGILADTSVDDSANYRAVFDGVSQSGYTITTTDDTFVQSGSKRGSPWRDLVLEKGWDYRLSFFAMHFGSTYDFQDGYARYDHDTTMSISVEGVHLTIYPFSDEGGTVHASDEVSPYEKVTVSVV